MYYEKMLNHHMPHHYILPTVKLEFAAERFEPTTGNYAGFYDTFVAKITSQAVSTHLSICEPRPIFGTHRHRPQIIYVVASPKLLELQHCTSRTTMRKETSYNAS